MGKQDAKQPKLNFDQRRATRLTESDPEMAAGGSTEGQLGDQGDDLRTLMLDMRSSLRTINAKLDTLTTQMESVKTQVGVHEHRLDVLENKQSDFHEFQVETKDQLLQMDKLLGVIRAKNEDLEARSRHNNLRITGIPETTAISKLELYVSEMLRVLFGEHLSPVFAVERAHRALGPKPPVGATPRPILARLLNYQDRDVVLRQARAIGNVTHQGNHISFYPDFTPAVQAARREFLPAKRILLQAQVPYSLLYPAKLKVSYDGSSHFFSDAKSALKFAKHVGGKQAKKSPRLEESTEHQLSDTD